MSVVPFESPDTHLLAQSRSVYLRAVLAGRRQEATSVVLQALRCGHAVEDVYVEVIQESLYEVGRLWEARRVTVADEHVATAITQSVLARALPLLPTPRNARGRAVVAGVESELHQVGAHMVADLLEADGWSVRFLGADVPADDVLRAVEEHGAELLGVSCTMSANVGRAESLVAAGRRRHAGLAVLVGGGAFRLAPALAREVGADGTAPSLREAVALARSLAPVR